MRDLQQYWAEIRAIESALPQFVWVIAEDCLIEVARAVAAKLLHAKSHRLATEEEVKARQAKDAAARKRQEQERKRRDGIAVIEL
jgi:hypothetical protein